MLYGFKAMKEEVHIVGYVFIIAFINAREYNVATKSVMLLHTLLPRNEVNDLMVQTSHCNE